MLPHRKAWKQITIMCASAHVQLLMSHELSVLEKFGGKMVADSRKRALYSVLFILIMFDRANIISLHVYSNQIEVKIAG